jgi:hypothetical protein
MGKVSILLVNFIVIQGESKNSILVSYVFGLHYLFGDTTYPNHLTGSIIF